MTFAEVENARKIYNDKRSKIIKNIIKIDVCLSIILFIIAIATNDEIRESAGVFLFGTIMSLIIAFLQVSMFAFIIGLIILAFTTKKEAAAYRNSYKAYFVAQGLQKVFTNIAYDHAKGLPLETVTAVMTSGDRYNSNDLTTGCYKNINFTQADVHTEEEHTDSDGDTTYITIFRGRFLIFDFNRNFSSNLQISSKHFHGETLPYSTASNRKFSKIQTESTEFNKAFRIYAQDGVDALYILDPAFMEKVQKLYADCKHEILLTFMDKKVYIAINDNKDSFEPPKPKQPLNEAEETAKIEADIRVITNFVDSLNLDRYFKGAKT